MQIFNHLGKGKKAFSFCPANKLHRYNKSIQEYGMLFVLIDLIGPFVFIIN